ncbi:MAG: type II toxin-antitoxin system mRNA interferase toxin, RelE/StbE family [bacterium]|nr:type II toxin-antitoxin system mRNA interferase toxin, RelE/StbE family [bacterium]
MKVEWSPLALERVDEIAEYIARDHSSAAARWINDLFDAVLRLEDYPESGRIVPEIGKHRIRELLFGDYRVIYRVQKKVEVLTVRRVSQLLRPEEIE